MRARLPRLYHHGPLRVSGTEIALNAGAAHHAARVLRLRPNDRIRLFNGTFNVIISMKFVEKE